MPYAIELKYTKRASGGALMRRMKTYAIELKRTYADVCYRAQVYEARIRRCTDEKVWCSLSGIRQKL